MLGRAIFVLMLASALCGLSGCGPSIYQLKVPVDDDLAAAVGDSERVIIDDLRRQKDREPHLGKDIWSCERWFGDETLQPSKLIYLDQRVADRTSSGTKVHIRLTRFDIVEYCEHAPGANATAAAKTAGGSIPGFSPAPTVGDTVVLVLTGDINGVPFDVSRRFDYGTLYRFPRLPSSSSTYRELLRSRLEEIIDEILNKIGAR